MGNKDIMHVVYEGENSEIIYQYIEQGYRSVFFYNDETAYNVLDDLDRMLVDTRKLFPDLHLVGFDGLCEENLGMKQISTIKIDYLRFAEAIYEVVKYRLEHPKKPCQRVIVPVSIHRRRIKE
jgi:DNA-binding LacI/PurR family transcriptional regulator